jgi:hypothetical protein
MSDDSVPVLRVFGATVKNVIIKVVDGSEVKAVQITKTGAWKGNPKSSTVTQIEWYLPETAREVGDALIWHAEEAGG